MRWVLGGLLVVGVAAGQTLPAGDGEGRRAGLVALGKADAGRGVAAALEVLRRPGEREDRDAALAAILAGPLTGESEGRVRLDGLFAAKDILGQSGAAYDQFLYRKWDRELTSTWKPPASYGEKREFTGRVEDVVLTAGVDGAVYRPGEPVKVDVCFENKSGKWAWVVKDALEDDWRGAWRWDLRKKATGERVENPGPGATGGSYVGPRLDPLAPHGFWRGSGCLQKALRLRTLVLPAGDYLLTVRCEVPPLARPADAGTARGSWEAPVMTFEVRGEPVKPGAEMVGLVGKKVGMADLEGDLTSGQADHRAFAWAMLREYGDAETVAAEERAHPEAAGKR
jgi:hypothetical protein